jgi:hypothetical protein
MLGRRVRPGGKMEPNVVLEIGGRKFRAVTQNLTANQDDFIYVQLRRSGAMDLLRRLGKYSTVGLDWTEDQRGEEMLSLILESQLKPLVLAGCLTEEGTLWRRESALKNAEFFGAVTDPDDKQILTKCIVSVVVGFFLSGALSSGTSRKSSSPNARARHTKSAGRMTSGTSRR